MKLLVNFNLHVTNSNLSANSVACRIQCKFPTRKCMRPGSCKHMGTEKIKTGLNWTPKPAIISCTRSSSTGGNVFLLLLNPLNTKLSFLPTLYKLWKTRMKTARHVRTLNTQDTLQWSIAFIIIRDMTLATSKQCGRSRPSCHNLEVSGAWMYTGG